MYTSRQLGVLVQGHNVPDSWIPSALMALDPATRQAVLDKFSCFTAGTWIWPARVCGRRLSDGVMCNPDCFGDSQQGCGPECCIGEWGKDAACGATGGAIQAEQAQYMQTPVFDSSGQVIGYKSVAGATTATAGTTAGSATAGGGAAMPTVQLANLSRPGQPFQVGDKFRVTVTGAANQPVSVTATQNGRAMGTTTYGATNASGVFQLEGQMAAEHVGDWVETWHVGTDSTAELTFSVTAAGAAGGGGGTSTSTGGGGGAADQTGYTTTGLLETLKKPVFDGIPLWGVIAAGAGVAAFLFSGRSR